MDFLPYIDKKKETAAAKKWRFVYENMCVHTQGSDPSHVLIARRPLESSNEYALGYRLANYNATTKSPFDLAIDSYLEVSNHIDVHIQYPAPELEEYISDYYLSAGLRELSLEEWVINVPGKYRQTDPNAVIVILPKHPDREVIPHYGEEIPDFNTVLNQRIEVDVRLVKSEDIRYVSTEGILFETGTWYYSERYEKPYYYGVTKEETYIIYPKKEGDKVIYVQQPLYLNKLTTTPVVAIANALVVEDGVEYYLSDYWGAAAWGNKYIGQDSDLQVCETRFTYPEKFVVKTKCTAPGCMPGLDNRYYVKNRETGNSDLCGTCGGNGYIIDTGPMGTHLIGKEALDPDGNIKPPVGYVSPDTAILEHSANRTWEYYSNMRKELNIVDQNLTNQSGESKSYDVAQKVTKVTNIVKDIYRCLDQTLNIIAEYRGYAPEVYVHLPEDFDVRSSADMVAELAELKAANVPYVVLVEATKKYMLKLFGNTEKNKRIFDFLAKVDKLFAYGTEDMVQAKALFGSSINNADLAAHTFGFQILDELFTNVKSFENLPHRAKLVLFERELESYIPEDAAFTTDTNSDKLRYSVGGLQGMIEIAKAVASGLYEREAAAQLVADRFNITVEQARAQLGTPQIASTTAEVDKIAKLT